MNDKVWKNVISYIEPKNPDLNKLFTGLDKTYVAGHAWRKQGSLIRQIIEEDPIGKRPLGRPRLRWEGYKKKNNRTRNQMERSGRGQEQMARFVFSDMVLMAETKKKNYWITRLKRFLRLGAEYY